MTNAEIRIYKKNREFLPGIKRIQGELKKINCDVWDKTLCGACAFAAYLVFKYAQSLNLKVMFCYCSHHCWCLVENVVVDITATQFFDLRKSLHNDLLITNNKNIYRKEGFKCEKSATNNITIFKMTYHWEDQCPKDLIKKFGRRLSENLNLPFLQTIDCTE